MSEQKPSKESLREVKREYKERRKADKERQKAADKYWAEQVNPGGSSASGSKVSSVGKVIIAAGAISAVFLGLSTYQNLTHSNSADTLIAEAPAATSTPQSPSPTSTSSTVSSPSPTPCVFCDTEAAKWAVGDHGLVTPKAARVGNFGPHQVEDAYAKAIAYLKAATLNRQVVFDGKLDPVVHVFSDETRTWLHQRHALALSSKGKKGIYWADIATRLVPGDWIHTGEIRLKNKFKVSLGRKNDELKIHYSVATAYWLTPKTGGNARAIVVRRIGDLYFYESSSNTVTAPYWGGGSNTSTASVCGSTWQHPDFTEAWLNPDQVPTPSKNAAMPSFDPTDTNSDAEIPSCYHDTSNFRSQP